MSSKYEHLDRDSLVRLLERRDAERQLGLVWERDEIEADQAINDDFVALRLDPALSHGEAPWRNLIIEGDNFDALRALRMSHKGAIRCIYIDPPYNTGNRDFVYNDRFVDKTHRFRHSLWLEFMYRRLLLARELLAEDGAIFVSIDDNRSTATGFAPSCLQRCVAKPCRRSRRILKPASPPSWTFPPACWRIACVIVCRSPGTRPTCSAAATLARAPKTCGRAFLRRRWPSAPSSSGYGWPTPMTGSCRQGC
jgi:hypothetical protein